MKNYLSEIARYYDVSVEDEWARLDRHRTEYAVTRRAMDKYLPPPPARLLDCGGGPGRYSIELAKLGYSVTLFDLSAENLDWARRQAAQESLSLEAYQQGTATDLSCFPSGHFDTVLLMGPLYHLLNEADRKAALSEAYRVLKPGGKLFAAFINRFAALRDLAIHTPERILTRWDLHKLAIETDQMVPGDKLEPQFIAYLAHPSEVSSIVSSAGFEVEAILGVEGLVAALEEQVNYLQGNAWEIWEEVNWFAAQDNSALGCADHLLVVACKPRWKHVLARVCRTLEAKGLAYCIVGGTAIKIHGLEVETQDIDIEVDGSEAYLFQEIFQEHCELPVAWREGSAYRSHFGKFRIDNIVFEIMGDLQRKEGQAWVSSRAQTAQVIEIEGVGISVSSLEEECLALIRRGKMQRAAVCLPSCDSNTLVELIRKDRKTEVI